jgi:hypothetical protein
MSVDIKRLLVGLIGWLVMMAGMIWVVASGPHP